MGVLGNIGEDRRFDDDFASSADYEDGFVESDAVRLRREALEASEAAERATDREARLMAARKDSAGRFDFSREASIDTEERPSWLPTPEQWEREAAGAALQYFGLTRKETAAMGLMADGSSMEAEAGEAAPACRPEDFGESPTETMLRSAEQMQEQDDRAASAEDGLER